MGEPECMSCLSLMLYGPTDKNGVCFETNNKHVEQTPIFVSHSLKNVLSEVVIVIGKFVLVTSSS